MSSRRIKNQRGREKIIDFKEAFKYIDISNSKTKDN